MERSPVSGTGRPVSANSPANCSEPLKNPTATADMNAMHAAAEMPTVLRARTGSPAPRNWPASVAAAT